MNIEPNFALFDNFERTHKGRSDHDASTYEFLNNSAQNSAKYVREIIGKWSIHFPVDKDFLNRFRSKRNKEHKGAFFELVMFQWLQRSGFGVVFQEMSITNSQRRPDFTLLKNGSKVFIAECTLSAATNDDEGRDRLQNQITDVLESISSPKWWVSIDFVRSSPNTVAKKVIKEFIKTTIEQEHRETTFNHNGWQIKFRLFPKSITTQRTLGSISGGVGGFIDSERPLRSALNNKRAKNYGEISIPFIICVNSSDPFLDDVSIGQTLFATSPNDDAYFICDGKPQNTGVSAILIFKGLVAWNLHAITPALWHNPWAAHPLPIEALPVDQVVHEIEIGSAMRMNKEIIKREIFGSVLGIDSTYLDGPIEPIEKENI